jgi:sulfopyruvate decarboxylase subunit alpha
MKAEIAQLFLNEIERAGIDTIVGLPDSGLYPLIKRIQDVPGLRYIAVTNEGEGAGICAGAWMGGRKPLLLMENSGLRVASETLARLGISFGVPVLMLMSYRGELGDGNWWSVNHGVVMEPLLDALRIPYTVLRRPEDIAGSVGKAFKNAQGSKYHYALVAAGDVLW